jgi:conjugal transfer pilus assembly protein TraD
MGIQEDITLEKLQRYSMDDINELVEKCKEIVPQLPRDIQEFAQNSLERLEGQASHPKEHYQKMITSLGPVLTSLNTGDVAPLLNASPEKSINWRDVFENNKVVYFELSSMLRQEVSNNVGKMIVQDLLYFIGELYAFDKSKKNMNLFVDEFYSVMFRGYIDMLNKSRGAGLRMFLGMQTTADIANALGDGQDSYVKQVLGNVANKFYLRVPEKELAQEFCDLFGTTYISQVDEAHIESSKSGTPAELFGTNTSQRKSHVEANIVSPDMLMHLPIGQAFAFMSARDPYKLRLPLIERPESQKNHFSDRIQESDIGRIQISNTSPWAEFDTSQVEWPKKPASRQ